MIRTPTMRVAWLELPHPRLSYYDALLKPLSERGCDMTVVRGRSTRRGLQKGMLRTVIGERSCSSKQKHVDVALVAFGWFMMETPWIPIPPIPEFGSSCNGSLPYNDECLCGSIPLVVLLNKEYAKLTEKLSWLQSHCVSAAMTVHHDASKYAAATGVPFHRIWFGVDTEHFAQPQHADAGYLYDLGFTGVVRADQTANWRRRIWKQAWPILADRGLRLYSGPDRGGVSMGDRHSVSFFCTSSQLSCDAAPCEPVRLSHRHPCVDCSQELNASEYASKMRATKVWLSTTGPADLVGTRFFEVMATGTTLCICNRMTGQRSMVYDSLGIREGHHAVMFESVAEFVDVVTNYTSRPEYEARRAAIVRNAQALARRKFSWSHVAERVHKVMQLQSTAPALAAGPAGAALSNGANANGTALGDARSHSSCRFQ